VFFGASLDGLVGENEYLLNLSRTGSTVSLIVLFNKIAIGDHNYIYSSDFAPAYQNRAIKALDGFANFARFSHISSIYSKENGVYYHAGKAEQSDMFLKSNIATLNIFSGNYSQALSDGSERAGHVKISGTNLDSIAGIEMEFEENVAENLSRVAAGVVKLLSSDNFISSLDNPVHVKGSLEFFESNKYPLFILGLAFVSIIIIYYLIYRGMAIKQAKFIANNSDIERIVMKISTNLGASSEDVVNKIRERVSEKSKGANGNDRDSNKQKDEEDNNE